MEVAQIRAEHGTFQKRIVNKYLWAYRSWNALSIKFSKKNFGGILRPKSVRRPLVIGLIYGSRANKKFDTAFWVFWTMSGPLRHSDSLFLSRDDCVNNFHVWKPVDAKRGPQDIVIYRNSPRAFSVVQKPWGWTHFSVQKPRGASGGGGLVSVQSDTCINSACCLGNFLSNLWP